MGTGLEDGEGGGSSGKPKVMILRPAPCQRIRGDLVVTVTASDNNRVSNVHITINDILYIDFTEEPYSRTIPSGMLPADNTYILRAIAYDNEGNSSNAEVVIRIDLLPPVQDNLLILDANADPFERGGAPGAVFRIIPETNTMCTLASSSMFKAPAAIAVYRTNGYIYVTDRAADLDGPGPGMGGVFRILPNRFNDVEPFAVDPRFRAPFGIDIASNGTIYVADYDADPYGLGSAPGAIFKINAAKVVTTVVSDARLVSPIGVTVVDDGSGDLWIVDADADTYYNQNRGSVWRYSAAAGALDPVKPLIAVSDQFVTPWEVRPDGAGQLILVDGGDYANNQPPRIFRIDPNAANPASAATLLFEGAPMVAPAGFVRWSANRYMIADRIADPIEDGTRGAILLYDSTAGEVTFPYPGASNFFVSPFDIAISPQ